MFLRLFISVFARAVDALFFRCFVIMFVCVCVMGVCVFAWLVLLVGWSVACLLDPLFIYLLVG